LPTLFTILILGGWFEIYMLMALLFFFILIYSHIARNIFYKSYIFINVWISGVIILLLLIATAFLGYVLPWGQISFWGATVITNLLRAIPYIGHLLTFWIWGGYSVNNATLSRFFFFSFYFTFYHPIFRNYSYFFFT